MSPGLITRSLQSRVAAIVMAVAAVVCACVYYFPHCGWEFWLAMVLNAGIAVLMLAINKRFKLIKSLTSLFAGLFMLMQLATPDIFGTVGPGLLLAIVVLLATAVMFASYSSPRSTLNVFSVFLMLSAGVLVNYSFLVYIPVFLVVCAQMRIFNVRVVIAALLGMITPWWIIFGLGLMQPADIRLPQLPDVFGGFDFGDAVHLTVTLVVTSLTIVSTMMMNALKTIAYNAKARAVNGVVLVVALVTVLAMAVDFTNVTSYIVLLNCCAAYQLAHYFAIHNGERSFIGIIFVILIYAMLFVWKTII